MPKIIPIKDLKNTSEISQMCHSSDEPIFVTKNGYSDMVVMSDKSYEKIIGKIRLYQMIAEGERDIENGRLIDSETVFAKLREKYDY